MKDSRRAIDYVLEIDVPDEAIVERMSGRRVAPGVGPHLPRQVQSAESRRARTTSPAKTLIQRDDDKEETVKKRLAVYHEQTEVLVGYYNKWAAVRPAGCAEVSQDLRASDRSNRSATRLSRRWPSKQTKKRTMCPLFLCPDCTPEAHPVAAKFCSTKFVHVRSEAATCCTQGVCRRGLSNVWLCNFDREKHEGVDMAASFGLP